MFYHQRQWRRSVVKSEGSGLLRSSHQTGSRPKIVFVCGAENGIFGHFRLISFSAENEFSCFIFGFRSKKMSFALGRKCYVRNWTVTKFCDIGTGDFRFQPKMEFHFRRHFRLRPKMKIASSVGLYIKLFQITSYVNDFQILNNPGFGQLLAPWKISFTLHFWHKSSFIVIIIVA